MTIIPTQGDEGNMASCADRSSPQTTTETPSPFVWRDIASAPRDGTPILAMSTNHDVVEVVCWQDGLAGASLDALLETDDEPLAGWVNNGAIKDRFYANPRWFTHWLPLPPAPSLDGEGEP